MIKGRHLYIYIYVFVRCQTGEGREVETTFTHLLSPLFSPSSSSSLKQTKHLRLQGEETTIVCAPLRRVYPRGKGRSVSPSNLLQRYSPSSQIPVHEVQILQVPHARRDLGRHVDETVETETREQQRRESREGKVKGREIARALASGLPMGERRGDRGEGCD